MYNYNSTHEADLEEINFENLLLLNETPECARKYMVRAEFPFSGEIDQSYCVFFTPAMIRMNGWDEQWVEEIDKVAFVDFKIESILLNEYDHAWITVTVEQVYLLNNLHTNLPARTDCSVLSKLGEYGELRFEKYGKWLVFSDTMQGTLGMLAIIRKYENDYYLVAYEISDFHSDYIYGGSFQVSEHTIKDWLTQAK